MRSSGCGASAEARFTPGLVHSGQRPTGGFALQQLADLHADRVGGDVGAAEMVAQQAVDLVRAGRALLHPHGHAPAGYLVVAAPGVVGRRRPFGGRLAAWTGWRGGGPPGCASTQFAGAAALSRKSAPHVYRLPNMVYVAGSVATPAVAGQLSRSENVKSMVSWEGLAVYHK